MTLLALYFLIPRFPPPGLDVPYEASAYGGIQLRFYLWLLLLVSVELKSYYTWLQTENNIKPCKKYIKGWKLIMLLEVWWLWDYLDNWCCMYIHYLTNIVTSSCSLLNITLGWYAGTMILIDIRAILIYLPVQYRLTKWHLPPLTTYPLTGRDFSGEPGIQARRKSLKLTRNPCLELMHIIFPLDLLSDFLSIRISSC